MLGKPTKSKGEEYMSELETLKKLYDGGINTQEAIKLLNLPSSEETIKILDMIKSHKVSVEDGKELLDAVSVKQVEPVINSGRNRVRGLGIVTMVLGILLMIFSCIMPFLSAFDHFDGTKQWTLSSDNSRFENEFRQAMNNIPSMQGNFSGVEVRVKQKNGVTEESVIVGQLGGNNLMRPPNSGVSVYPGFPFFAFINAGFLWLAGLIIIRDWGRKMGVVVSWISIALSFIFIVIDILFMVR